MSEPAHHGVLNTCPPWDCVGLSGPGMGTERAKGHGRALASAVVAGCAPTEIWCNGSISVSHLKRGTFNAAGTFQQSSCGERDLGRRTLLLYHMQKCLALTHKTFHAGSFYICHLANIVVGGRPFVTVGGPLHMYIVVCVHRVYS